ncbi:hypothetical protein V5738_11850 [Salinisphaera sp. SPP-AMP-43]|uniref:hypothetical protein n=1 Tax=Salinisphaera sp. SPP-AMP-43 TaxID=3121288 RepID=UPI003C6E4926
MAGIVRLISCLLALLVAIVLFVHGLFVQTGWHVSSLAAIELFGLSLLFFATSTAYGLWWRATR